MQLKQFFIRTEDEVKTSGLHYYNNNKKIIISTHGMQTNGMKERDEIIAEKVVTKGYDYITFNNRGREVITMINKLVNGKMECTKAGTAYEEVEESYYDIKSVIKFCIENKYEEIILQGHSLGSIKTVYVYNRLKNENSSLLKYIKGVILLSMPDIPELVKYLLQDKYNEILNYAIEKEKTQKQDELMPDNVFLCPISVKNFLYYLKYNENINFVQLSNEQYEFPELNNIDSRLLIIYGNNGEFITQEVNDLIKFLKGKLKKDVIIDYIDGANHMYTGKEAELADKIYQFL